MRVPPPCGPLHCVAARLVRGSRSSRYVGQHMEASNTSTPVTDGEQWSDENNIPPPTDEATPEDVGYAPLEYQILDDDDHSGDEVDEDSGGEEDPAAEEVRRETTETVESSQQNDVGV